jgi:hypothetical protein
MNPRPGPSPDGRAAALARLKALTTLPEGRVAAALDEALGEVTSRPRAAALPVIELAVMRAAERLWDEERRAHTERVA